MAEFGKVHRYEPSGALHGLMRVRAFTQDDAHIFCTEDQITAEAGGVCKLLLDIYRDFGFTDVVMKLADRPPKRVGDDALWDRAEGALARAMDALGLPLHPEQGARARSTARRSSSCCATRSAAIGSAARCRSTSTSPTRLGATYIGEDGNRHTPVLLHRAIFGSLERFIGMLLEHYAGALPFWLSPAAGRRRDDHVGRGPLRRASRRSTCAPRACAPTADLRNEKINYKVREHSLAKIPVMIAVGKREVAESTVAIRRLGQQEQVEPAARGRDRAAARGSAERGARRAPPRRKLTAPRS